jgi:hypothetical protein
MAMIFLHWPDAMACGRDKQKAPAAWRQGFCSEGNARGFLFLTWLGAIDAPEPGNSCP